MSDARHWLTFSALMGAVLGTVSACPLIDDPNHCANMAENPCLPAQVCDPCVSSSSNNGCVAEDMLMDRDPQAAGCQSMGGATTVEATESDTTASTTMDATVTTTLEPDTTATEGDTETTTGIPVECMESDGTLGDGCPDDAPFCVGGTCTSCMGSPIDCATAGAPGGDVCDPSGRCVECNDQDASACEGSTPVCDAEGLTCVACTAHDQCAGGAGCHLFVGSCLPADRVFMVDGAAPMCNMAGQPYCGVSSALAAAGGGTEATIRVASGSYFDTLVIISSGAIVAIIAEGDVTIVGDNGSPTVTLNSSSTGYLAGMTLDNISPAPGVQSAGDLRMDDAEIRNADTGLSSSAGRVHLERVRIIGNDLAGISLGGTDPVMLRDVIVANNGTGTSPRGFVTTAATPFEILYSTIADNAGTTGGAINSPSGVGTVRNSIIVSNSLTNSIGVTTTITVENSLVADDDFSGEPGNFPVVSVGDIMFDGGYEIPVGSSAADVAIWMDGDPLTDINGVMRPAMMGSLDYAGADLPD